VGCGWLVRNHGVLVLSSEHGTSRSCWPLRCRRCSRKLDHLASGVNWIGPTCGTGVGYALVLASAHGDTCVLDLGPVLLVAAICVSAWGRLNETRQRWGQIHDVVAAEPMARLGQKRNCASGDVYFQPKSVEAPAEKTGRGGKGTVKRAGPGAAVPRRRTGCRAVAAGLKLARTLL